MQQEIEFLEKQIEEQNKRYKVMLEEAEKHQMNEFRLRVILNHLKGNE